MDVKIFSCREVPAYLRDSYRQLLYEAELHDDNDGEHTVLMTDEDDNVLACGSLRGKVLKQLAVSERAEGAGCCAAVVSELVSLAASLNRTKLFLYTKPKHREMFCSMGFYPLAATEDMLMTENSSHGLSDFLRDVPHYGGCVASIVCNCNPFTLGHRHLIETAAGNCDELLVFVISEEQGMFPGKDRIELVCRGTSDLKNVHVIPGGDYVLSPVTFPTYFIKDQSQGHKAQCELDLALFSRKIAPELNISLRYVGEEPFDRITEQYNRRMEELLPANGIRVVEIPRYRGISAGYVRKMIMEGRLQEVRDFLPDSTYEYCRDRFGAGAPLQG